MKKSNQVYEMYSFQLFAVVLYTYLVWEGERLMLPSKAPCYYRLAQMVIRDPPCDGDMSHSYLYEKRANQHGPISMQI